MENSTAWARFSVDADAEHADLALVRLQVGDEGAEAGLDVSRASAPSSLAEFLARGRRRCPRACRSCGLRIGDRVVAAGRCRPAACGSWSRRTAAIASAAPAAGRAACHQRAAASAPRIELHTHDASPVLNPRIAPGSAWRAPSAARRRRPRAAPPRRSRPSSMNTTRVPTLAGEAHLVRDDHHGHALGCQLAHDQQHLAAQFRVERGGRLVEQQDAWATWQARGRSRRAAAGRPTAGPDRRRACRPGRPWPAASRPWRPLRRAASSARRIGASITFSSTVICGHRLNCWNTMPISARTRARRGLTARSALGRGDRRARPSRTRPVARLFQQRQAAQQRRLARAAGADDADDVGLSSISRSTPFSTRWAPKAFSNVPPPRSARASEPLPMMPSHPAYRRSCATAMPGCPAWLSCKVIGGIGRRAHHQSH